MTLPQDNENMMVINHCMVYYTDLFLFLSPILFSIVGEAPASAKDQEKEIKGINFGKRSKQDPVFITPYGS